MTISLKYGKSTKDFELPEKAELLSAKEPEFSIDKQKFINELASKLPKDESKYKNIGAVVADKTRLCDYPKYLPWVLETLHQKGAEKENINFYIAYGTHPKQSDEESILSYGEVYNEYNFIQHDCYGEEAFADLGTTSRGTIVKVRHDVLESSLLITFGAISHHYFAGYGGGRKLLFPGLAARKSVYQNHGLFLDRKEKQLSTGCQPGNLTGNPIAEDLKEIDDLMPGKISIHGILNSKGVVVDLLVGSSYGDFESACQIHDSYYRSNHEKEYDLVITSSGGYPKDINFIQAHKSIHHSAAFVKDGGKLIVLSECMDGIASDFFLKYFEAGSFENAFKMLEENYEGNGGTALSMMTKTKRIEVIMHTSLDKNLCRTLHVTKADTNKIQEIINKETGSIAAIQNASLLVK